MKTQMEPKTKYEESHASCSSSRKLLRGSQHDYPFTSKGKSGIVGLQQLVPKLVCQQLMEEEEEEEGGNAMAARRLLRGPKHDYLFTLGFPSLKSRCEQQLINDEVPRKAGVRLICDQEEGIASDGQEKEALKHSKPSSSRKLLRGSEHDYPFTGKRGVGLKLITPKLVCEQLEEEEERANIARNGPDHDYLFTKSIGFQSVRRLWEHQFRDEEVGRRVGVRSTCQQLMEEEEDLLDGKEEKVAKTFMERFGWEKGDGVGLSLSVHELCN